MVVLMWDIFSLGVLVLCVCMHACMLSLLLLLWALPCLPSDGARFLLPVTGMR